MRVKLLLILIILIGCHCESGIASPPAEARNDVQNHNGVHEFKSIPILHQGRIKPLDSYARAVLLRFSGKSTFERKPAIDWLARALFVPEQTFNDEIFLINNPEVVEALNVKPKLHRRYSFSELKPGSAKLQEYAQNALTKEESKRSEIEKEFLRVFLNIYSYLGIVDSLQFYAEHTDFAVTNQNTINRLNLQKQNSLFDLFNRTAILGNYIGKLGSPSTLGKDDQEMFILALNLYTWIENHKTYKEFLEQEEPLTVIYSKEKQMWIDPWDALLSKEHNYNQELLTLQEIYQAYTKQDEPGLTAAVTKFKTIIFASNKNISPYKISLELIYNQVNPFLWAKIIYGLVFILALILLGYQSSLLGKGSLILLYSGFLLHLYGIVSRIVILQRPPVTNLYETFIFISLVMVLIGLLIQLFDKKSSLGILLAAFSGLVLLLISGKFAAEGDTMQVLIAVLNSNFWLSTHVICVSLGYAAVAFAGLVGHIYLLQKTFKVDETTLKKTQDLIYAVIGFGLCFSFLGTMLGGVWADQSWGRFWGWDPKENGALIIVLWCAVLFHARMAGLIKSLGFATGATIGTMVVMTSWLGINLLGVGLHSYGFTSGLARGLYAYYGFELVFILVSLFVINRHSESSKKV